jgi:hypothetical protein
MSDVYSVGQMIHEGKVLPVTATEVRVPEVGASAWVCPQTVVRGDIEEGECWDGLS